MKNVVWLTRDRMGNNGDYNAHTAKPNKAKHLEEHADSDGIVYEATWEDRDRCRYLIEICPKYFEAILPKQDRLKPGEGPKKFWLLSDRQYQELKGGK